MGVLGLVSGLAVAASGIVLYVLADKIPPNPFIGVRVGYAYVSKRAWVRVMKAGSALLTLLGIAAAMMSYPFGDLAALMGIGLGSVALTYFIIHYAEKVGEEESLRTPEVRREPLKEIPKVAPPLAALLIVAGSAIISTLYVVINYPNLPAQVPTHFGPNWKPDAYSPKSVALGTVLADELIIIPLTAFIYYLGWSKPEALYKPWFDIHTYLKVVNTLYILLALVNMLVGLGNAIMVIYTLNNNIPEWFTYSFDAGLIGILLCVAYLFAVTVQAYRKVKVSFPTT